MSPSRRQALQWAAGHRAWIEKQLAQIVPVAALADGAELPLYGIPHRIEWNPAMSRIPHVEAGCLVVGGPAENLEARILRWRFGLDDQDELPLKQIGDKYNLSRERIRQLQEQALQKMRRALARRDYL